MSVKQDVQDCIKVLDEDAPDWRERVNLDTLDLCDPLLCILGQVYGSYHQRPQWKDMPGFCGELNYVIDTSQVDDYAAEWRRVLSS